MSTKIKLFRQNVKDVLQKCTLYMFLTINHVNVIKQAPKMSIFTKLNEHNVGSLRLSPLAQTDGTMHSKT